MLEASSKKAPSRLIHPENATHSDDDHTPLTATAGWDVTGLAGVHDHESWPLNFEVGEGFPSQTLGGPALSSGRAGGLLPGE